MTVIIIIIITTIIIIIIIIIPFSDSVNYLVCVFSHVLSVL